MEMGQVINFRAEAKKALMRATSILNQVEGGHVYASIELRMALEALVYEEAKQYREELSESQYKTWQPRQLLKTLLEYDEFADSSFELRVALNNSHGEVHGDFTSLGECKKLKLKTIKEYYDKLGSWLHMPTQVQLEKGFQVEKKKIIDTCDEIIKILDDLLSAPIHSARFKTTTEIECFKCDRRIIRVVNNKQYPFKVDCPECDASYELNKEGEKIVWRALREVVNCASPDCTGSIKLFHVEVKEGTHWLCSICKKRNRISLCVTAAESE
jgi:hypothetical protein